jgi:GT2 family glycosyltransferase
MKVFLIILNFNGKKFISNCLNSVNKLKVENFELKIIVVDNASADGSEKIIESLKTKIKNLIFIQNKENLGFAEGNNVGIRYALEDGADYIMILNPDTLVDKNLLIQLIKVAESDKKIGILGPKIYFASGFEYHKERYKDSERGRVIFYAGGEIDWDNVLSKHRGVDEVDKGQYEKIEETDFVTGCAMMIKREVFEKIGFFDKNYFLYWEDSDFCQRAKKAGYKIVYVPLGLVWHLDAGSSKVGGSLHDYYLTRNRLLFGMKYASFRAKFALLRESIKILFFGRKWQKIGIRDFYLGKFSKGSYM